MRTSIYFSLLVLLFLVACRQQVTENEGTTTTTEPVVLSPEDLEAREDSLELAAAFAAQQQIPIAVEASAQTDIILAENTEDAADDPAIWLHPEDPAKSLIYGSNKRGGLAVYDLSGKEIAYYPIGNINNVDVIYDFPLGGKKTTLLGCSNRSQQSIDLFVIDPVDGKLTDITARPLLMDSTLIDDIYGFCFAKKGKNSYVLINGKNGLMQQYELLGNAGKVDIALRRSHQFASQTEGMVADNRNGRLFVGEENVGVWKMDIDPADTTVVFLEESGTSNPMIRPDVEGITLWENGDAGYLIVSSQGNFSYALFDRNPPHQYVTSFKIVDGAIDGAEETDGLDIVGASLPNYPQGLLVVQDGFNYEGTAQRPQNFKLVSWEAVLRQIQD